MSIRSVVWIGSGEMLAAEAISEDPNVDVVWERDAVRARQLPLGRFDALVVAAGPCEAALGFLRDLTSVSPLPPLLAVVDTADARELEALRAQGAQAVYERQRHPNEGGVAKQLRSLVAPAEPGPSLRVASANEAAIVGRSAPMREVFALIGHASRSRVTVLLTGETGTGKELLARSVHDKSERCRHAFVAVNCAAFPETLLESELFGHRKGAFTGADRDRAGLFEAADGGTIFLDEVGETSAPFQAKLLRVLQEREVRALGGSRAQHVDVRVIAATNRNLRGEAIEGRFRSDLYYRLAVFPIHVPPLRERPADVLPLISHFLAQHGETETPLELTKEAERLLLSHRWPGNVRELENEIQRALAIRTPGERLEPAHFSDRLRADLAPVETSVHSGETLRETLGRVEAWLIRRALDANQDRRATTARVLGITREGLYKKMKRHGIE